ncbi:MAG: hypothetical protein NVS1B11_36950 [Terriglobales bacterium]
MNYQEFLDSKKITSKSSGFHVDPAKLNPLLFDWLSPYMGIGSEGYVAIRNDRRFVGAELKRSYWMQACGNLSAAETAGKNQYALFAEETA